MKNALAGILAAATALLASCATAEKPIHYCSKDAPDNLPYCISWKKACEIARARWEATHDKNGHPINP